MGSMSLTLPKLGEYDVCPQFGFASSDGVLLSHLNSNYNSWDDILAELSVLIATRRLRPAVRALPLLTSDKLGSNAERRRAYVTLACLTQAYVFEDAEHPEAVIPPALSEPFLQICEYWGLQPILSNVGYCLWNWKLKEDLILQSSAGSYGDTQSHRELLLQTSSKVDVCGSFTSTQDEKTFCHAPLLVETEGGSMIPILLDAIKAASAGNTDTVITILESCHITLTAMAQHLQLLHRDCDPQVFYHQFRKFIAGSKGLPEGFVFQRANGDQVQSRCVGASAVQSPIFQFLDHVFGIEHKTAFLREMRQYMPRKHRDFLAAVEQLPSLRYFVQMQSENDGLTAAFEQCVVQLRAWRTKHIGVVTRYVVMPAKRQTGQEEVKGTGGSLPIPFLKETRDETA